MTNLNLPILTDNYYYTEILNTKTRMLIPLLFKVFGIDGQLLPLWRLLSLSGCFLLPYNAFQCEGLGPFSSRSPAMISYYTMDFRFSRPMMPKVLFNLYLSLQVHTSKCLPGTPTLLSPACEFSTATAHLGPSHQNWAFSSTPTLQTHAPSCQSSCWEPRTRLPYLPLSLLFHIQSPSPTDVTPNRWISSIYYSPPSFCSTTCLLAHL